MKDKNTFLIIIILVVVIFITFQLWSRDEGYENQKNPEIEYISQHNTNDMRDDDSFQLIGGDDSFQIGFGMGPGLYGSGRHTSEMVGN